MGQPVKKSPQIGVRFPKAEMAQIEQAAKQQFAGNKSVLVRVAVLAWLAANATENKEAA